LLISTVIYLAHLFFLFHLTLAPKLLFQVHQSTVRFHLRNKPESASVAKTLDFIHTHTPEIVTRCLLFRRSVILKINKVVQLDSRFASICNTESSDFIKNLCGVVYVVKKKNLCALDRNMAQLGFRTTILMFRTQKNWRVFSYSSNKQYCIISLMRYSIV